MDALGFAARIKQQHMHAVAHLCYRPSKASRPILSLLQFLQAPIEGRLRIV